MRPGVTFALFLFQTLTTMEALKNNYQIVCGFYMHSLLINALVRANAFLHVDITKVYAFMFICLPDYII